MSRGLIDQALDYTATNMDKMFTIKNYSWLSQSATTWYKGLTKDITLAGYTPIAIYAYSTNQADANFYNVSISGNSLSAGISKTGRSGTISSLNVYVSVLYVKSPLVYTT